MFSSDVERNKKDEDVESVDSSDDETVDEKRNRLAKKMLDEIKEKCEFFDLHWWVTSKSWKPAV